MPRRPRYLLVPARLSLLAVLVLCSTALALPAEAQSDPLRATGSLTGSLKQGQTVQVRLTVTHTSGWQKISDVELDLLLRGVTLERIVLDPTRVSVVIEGRAGPEAFGAPTALVGNFFSLNAASIGFAARGRQAIITFPLRVLVAPPANARLMYSAHGFDDTVLAPRPLAPPIEGDTGFTWGALAVAAAAALFAGSFLGSTFASRRRPPPKPSVYATVHRRLEDERSNR